MPSLTPLASLYAPIPLSGAFVALFAIEQLINGWRHGFAGDDSIPNVVLYLPRHIFPESIGCFKSPTGAGYICP